MNTQTFDQVLESSFDFEGLSAEEKKSSKEYLQNLIIENALLRVMDMRDLSLKQFEAFQKNVLSEDSVEKRIEYLDREFPDFNRFVFLEVEELKAYEA